LTVDGHFCGQLTREQFPTEQLSDEQLSCEQLSRYLLVYLALYPAIPRNFEPEVFHRSYALPVTQPKALKHRKQKLARKPQPTIVEVAQSSAADTTLKKDLYILDVSVLGLYRIFASYSLRPRIVGQIDYLYSAE